VIVLQISHSLPREGISMAGVRRSWALALVVLLMAAIAGLTVRGQTATKPNKAGEISENNGLFRSTASLEATGSIAGRLTDLMSTPLGGATLVLRNEATGTESRTTTGRNGSYRFTGLAAGDYTLEAESERLGRGRLEGIVVAAGHEARLQTAMEFELQTSRSNPGIGHATGAANPELSPARSAVSAEASAERPAASEMPASAALAIASIVGNSVREMPGAQTPALIAEFASIPPLEMAVSGRPVVELVREIPATMTPVVTAVVAEETLQGLALRGFELTQTQWTAPARVAASDVDPVTAAVTTTLTAEQLQGLPVSGRRWQDFVLDTPTAAAEAGGGPQQSLRGAGQEPAETRVDGASMRLAFGAAGGSGADSGAGAGSSGQGSTASPSGMGRAWVGGRGFVLGETAGREVQTTAGNVEAETARSAGGRMNLDTERGTNGLHGQGFLFDRQNTWGAQNPFSQWIKESAPATESTIPTFMPLSYTPPDHETTWGIGVGSQLRRDKLFWFGALDGYERNDPGLATVKHPEQFFAQPSNDQMQVLSARLGLSGANPVAAGLAAYSNMLETLDGLLGPSPRTAAQWVGFARMDWKAAERHRFSLEGTGATWNSPGGGLTRVSETYGANSFGTSEASEEWLLGRWEAFITPNLMAVTQGSAGRNILSDHAETPSGFEQKFLNPSVWGQLPQIVVDSHYGFTIGNPSRFGEGSYPDEKLYEGQEMLDWVRGSLLVKAGLELNHNADATSLLRNQTGTYSYSSVENFASDALAFAAFGVGGELNPNNEHNCDQTGKVWRDSTGTLRGLGYLPCYSYYSQVMGPTNWHLSTNDWPVTPQRSGSRGSCLWFPLGCVGNWSRCRRRLPC
jgi:hypothetical protein